MKGQSPTSTSSAKPSSAALTAMRKGPKFGTRTSTKVGEALRRGLSGGSFRKHLTQQPNLPLMVRFIVQAVKDFEAERSVRTRIMELLQPLGGQAGDGLYQARELPLQVQDHFRDPRPVRDRPGLAIPAKLFKPARGKNGGPATGWHDPQVLHDDERVPRVPQNGVGRPRRDKLGHLLGNSLEQPQRLLPHL